MLGEVLARGQPVQWTYGDPLCIACVVRESRVEFAVRGMRDEGRVQCAILLLMYSFCTLWTACVCVSWSSPAC